MEKKAFSFLGRRPVAVTPRAKMLSAENGVKYYTDGVRTDDAPYDVPWPADRDPSERPLLPEDLWACPDVYEEIGLFPWREEGKRGEAKHASLHLRRVTSRKLFFVEIIPWKNPQHALDRDLGPDYDKRHVVYVSASYNQAKTKAEKFYFEACKSREENLGG